MRVTHLETAKLNLFSSIHFNTAQFEYKRERNQIFMILTRGGWMAYERTTVAFSPIDKQL